MNEVFINFSSNGLKLYGMLHRPEGIDLAPAVILLHGLTGERVESHRIFVKLARNLAKDGIAVLRFDFCGSGESEGEFSEITISRWVEDALAGLDWLLQQPGINQERLGLLGLSMGGSTAAIVAGRRPEQVKVLVLWSAAAYPNSVIPAWLQKANPIPKNNGYDVGGNILGSAFLADLVNCNPLKEVERFDGPALIIHGMEDALVPFTNADAFLSALKGPTRKHLLAEANHTFTSVAWEEEVLTETLKYLKMVLLDSSEMMDK